MSIFRHVRDFPEYYDVVSKMEDLNSYDVKMLASLRGAFLNDFEKFISGQPDYIQTGMKVINETGKLQIENISSLVNSLVAAPNDLFVFRTKLESLQKQFNTMVEQEKEAKRCVEAVEKARLSRDQAKLRNDPKLIEKNESAYSAAINKSEIETKKSNDYKDLYKQSSANHKIEFPKELFTFISGVCNNRKKSAVKSISYAKEFIDAALSLHEAEDPVVPKLKERLAQWDEELLEK